MLLKCLRECAVGSMCPGSPPNMVVQHRSRSMKPLSCLNPATYYGARGWVLGALAGTSICPVAGLYSIMKLADWACLRAMLSRWRYMSLCTEWGTILSKLGPCIPWCPPHPTESLYLSLIHGATAGWCSQSLMLLPRPWPRPWPRLVPGCRSLPGWWLPELPWSLPWSLPC